MLWQAVSIGGMELRGGEVEDVVCDAQPASAVEGHVLLPRRRGASDEGFPAYKVPLHHLSVWAVASELHPHIFDFGIASLLDRGGL